MRYLWLPICPVYAFVEAERPFSGVTCFLVDCLALATWSTGLGPLLHGICILWAFNALGAADEAARVKKFVRLVRQSALKTR